jgi:hypothetical protein
VSSADASGVAGTPSCFINVVGHPFRVLAAAQLVPEPLHVEAEGLGVPLQVADGQQGEVGRRYEPAAGGEGGSARGFCFSWDQGASFASSS